MGCCTHNTDPYLAEVRSLGGRKAITLHLGSGGSGRAMWVPLGRGRAPQEVGELPGPAAIRPPQGSQPLPLQPPEWRNPSDPVNVSFN